MKSIRSPSQKLFIWVRERSFNHNVIKIKLQSSFITLRLKNDKVLDIFSLFLQYLDRFKFDLGPWAIILKRNSIVYNMSSNSSRLGDHIFGQIKVKLRLSMVKLWKMFGNVNFDTKLWNLEIGWIFYFDHESTQSKFAWHGYFGHLGPINHLPTIAPHDLVPIYFMGWDCSKNPRGHFKISHRTSIVGRWFIGPKWHWVMG